MIRVVHQILCDKALEHTIFSIERHHQHSLEKVFGYGECMAYERIFRMPNDVQTPIEVSIQDAINSGWHIEPPTVDGKVTCPLCQEAGNQTTTKE